MDLRAYEAAVLSAAWRDMSHFGRFRCTGRDAASLLHHLTTNDIKGLKPGQGCDSVLVTNHARLLDWLTVFRLEAGYMVITSPNRRELFKPHAQKFVLFRQDVAIEDVTEATALAGVLGPQAAACVDLRLGATSSGVNSVSEVASDIFAARTARLPGGGVFLWSWQRETLLQTMEQSSIVPLDSETYNVLRVEAGLPAAGLELTEERNPWEARLDKSISLAKGCYNGQEVVARLHTYKKVKQYLCGLKLTAPAEAGDGVSNGERPAGSITSAVISPRFGPLALAYLKPASAEAGQVVVTARGAEAVVSALPFGDS